MWNDTTKEPTSITSGPPYLKDWNDACANEPTGGCSDYHTQYPNPAPMNINTARLEGDNPSPADLYWGQGTDFNNRLTQEISNESAAVELIVYRLEVDNITEALISKHQAGVNVRVIVDPAQYTNNAWPEYWLTHANVDKLYAAGVPMLLRTHAGVTHLKTLITSDYATNASSNFAPNWQRDHDYFVSAATKPSIYQAFVNQFQAMWSDTTNFGPFAPTPPAAATLSNPGSGATGVATNVTLVWSRASYATSYDIYLGTSSNALTKVANVAAQLVQNPPTSYSWTASALQPGTTYFWKVVSRTFATPIDSAMIASSTIRSFTTGGSTSGAASNPSPANGASSVGTSPMLTWTGSGSTYNVALGTSNPPPPVVTGLTTASYRPTTLSAGTIYFWSVTSVAGGTSIAGPTWSFSTATASGGSLPSPWQNQDVGNTNLAGSASYATGTFTVSGSGADIWGTADAFQYVYQPLSGDGQLVARVTGVQNTNGYAKAGVMLRASTAAGAADVILDVRPGGSIELMSRASNGGATTFIAGGTQAAPAWLKLTRNGSTITGFVSANGSTWTSIGSTTIAMSGPVIGLAVTSHDRAQLNRSTFDNVSVTTSGGSSPPPPATPNGPSPATGATAVATNATLSWSASSASSYEVAFGTVNPPPTVSSQQAGSTYTPGTLKAGTTYFWQIVARNSVGTTNGPVWSFTTGAAATPKDIVIYASDIAASAIHGVWSKASDPTSPNGIKLVTPDNGWTSADAPLASPADYIDITFSASASVPYTLWLRMHALNDNKYNDSLWVQFSDAQAGGSSIYPMNSTSGLDVNLASDSTGSSLAGWGWDNRAYWLAQTTTLTFATSGTHTVRIQVREDGVQFDQVVLSPSRYLSSPPGPLRNDSTIVPKP
jgi:hypothetical protein